MACACGLQDLTHILETQIPHLMNLLPKTSEDMVDEAGHQVHTSISYIYIYIQYIFFVYNYSRGLVGPLLPSTHSSLPLFSAYR
jgi:hypothetical protein